MGRPYGDDLRRKFLYAYDQGEGTLGDLAGRFSVSLGWAKNISAQRNRTGQAEWRQIDSQNRETPILRALQTSGYDNDLGDIGNQLNLYDL